MPTTTAATPMAFVRAMVLAYERRNLDPAAALKQAQITPAQLRDPHARITAAQMELVSALAMQQLDDEALGWFTRRLPWGSYGMLCRASITSPRLGLALARWCRHHRLLTDDVTFTLAEANGQATLAIAEQRALGPLREICLVTLLRYVHGFACWAVDSRMPLVQVHFPYSPPPHASAYAHMFPGPVRFDAPDGAGFAFDAAYLELPLRRDEAALQRMLERALPLTVGPYRRDRLLVARVRALLAQRAHELTDATRIADALHLSVRSLHRQLRDEGSSLQALKDEARCARASELLRRTSRPIKQIAQAVGFRNDKSFARAFRQWTGLAPSALRGPEQALTRAPGCAGR